ncbi:MAG: aldo/keto reductase [Actinomycetota bacterium]|nr:aldo/keto reductase [Actinomycetota bacterium]
MELRKLGDSDLSVSRIALGCNNFGRRLDLEGTRAVVDAALDAGINFLDTAESYGEGEGDSERYLGEVLRGRRDRVVLATKFGGGPVDGTPRGSAGYIRNALERSLERLQTDYLDLYYYHAPDGVTPVAETLAALQEFVEQGKVRGIGCSNFSAAQLREADEAGRSSGKSRFVALQNQYSLLERDADADVLPLCRELNVGFVPYSPLASGLLTGKYTRGEPPPEGTRLSFWAGEMLNDETFDEVDKLAAFAEERGHSLHELAIAAVAWTPGIPSVLVGATSPEQVRANATADWELAPDELDAVPRVEGRGVHTGPPRR